MNLDWTQEDHAFRAEVRAFLDEALTPDLRDRASRMTSVYADYATGLEWQKRLHAKGWVAPAWPKAFGGCEWTAAERFIWTQEAAAAGAPPVSPMGVGMCGPILIAYGTPEQRARFLPPMLSGEEFWCQGYSEPQAGSDLARLQMSAVDDGDAFVCNGHKIWTTHGQHADWIFCLVRTSSEGRPQQGITFLLIDMHSPGVEVRPIVFLTGEHIQNEIFFTDVRVPKANVVGAVGEGWTVAKHLLQFERGGGTASPGFRARVAGVAAVLRRPEVSHAPDAPALRAALAELAAAVDALEGLELRVLSRLASNEAPGPESSMLKVLHTELSQRLTEISLAAAGDYARPWQPHAVAPGGDVPAFAPPADGAAVGPAHARPAALKYFNDRAGSIYGGANEIQRNIMAKAVLGL
jgi:alkylation response protein AidB-like acyl-CoA dehydrogenase